MGPSSKREDDLRKRGKDSGLRCSIRLAEFHRVVVQISSQLHGFWSKIT